MPAPAVTVEVSGEPVVLRGDRALFWPRHRWLIVADVHLGKVQSLRRDGVALPDAIVDADLARLARAVRESDAARVVVLGDLVHDAHGLTPALVARVARWRETVPVPIALVPGNHDRRVECIPASWDIATWGAVVVEPPFRFSHEAPGTDGAFAWQGHVHPAVNLRGPRDRLRLPCFVVGARGGILPAFSALTGGDASPRAPGERLYVVVDGHVAALPPR